MEPLAPQLAGLAYPCVVKPIALSGSRGVIRADSPAELLAACERVRAILGEVDDPEERSRLLVEGFVPGPELALEGLLHDGGLRVLALFDKPDPLDGPFFEETYYVTPSRRGAATQALIARRVQEACRAFGLTQGPVHAEVRLWGGDAWVLEVAARTIGGQCARLLRFGTGRGLEELVLAQAAGLPLEVAEPDQAAGVLMIPTPVRGLLRRVEGVLAALRVPLVEDVEISVREGYPLVPLPEGSTYLGFVFARGPTPEQVERALREAHACLRVVTAPLLALGGG
jgi:biotin carboxylase